LKSVSLKQCLFQGYFQSQFPTAKAVVNFKLRPDLPIQLQRVDIFWKYQFPDSAHIQLQIVQAGLPKVKYLHTCFLQAQCPKQRRCGEQLLKLTGIPLQFGIGDTGKGF
jgi:hypothetical protein